MDYKRKLVRDTTILILVNLIVIVAISGAFWGVASTVFDHDAALRIGSWSIATGILLTASARLMAGSLQKPLKTLSDEIVFLGHSSRGGVAPDLDKLIIGKAIVAALSKQVSDLVSMSQQSSGITESPQQNPAAILQAAAQPATQTSSGGVNSIIDHVALPLIGIDSNQKVTLLNREAQSYLGQTAESSVGKAIYDIANLSFPSNETFEAWLKNSQENTAVNTRVWERVRIVDSQGNAQKQFDLIASFSKGHQSGTETILAIYDRTQQYTRDDGEISFVSLAVHELRTPLTIMRGYIEIFEDEVGPTLDDEMRGFMSKMTASAQQLAAFVGNILNVARVEENQLTLQLKQENWGEILKVAVEDLGLRAKVHDKTIEVHIAENLPAIAADRISLHEVINNLVDNAIKYSGDSKKIVIKTYLNSEGMIETSVQDFGIGIPQSVVPDLFQKFYRSHKSRAQVGGTGLGLYLCKALVNAHGGHIWLRSEEGAGSTFTFTVEQYDSVKHQQESGEDGIMRGAHGWIKNHSMNRQ